MGTKCFHLTVHGARLEPKWPECKSQRVLRERCTEMPRGGGPPPPPAGVVVAPPPPPPGSQPEHFVSAADGSPGGTGGYPQSEILSDINRKTWNDYRQNEEKIHIQKVFSDYGFKYTFEAATSSSQRREDDKITYINKGQFYGISLGTLYWTPQRNGHKTGL